jgi:ABC-type Fe3+-siderophore transport system permease subunit
MRAKIHRGSISGDYHEHQIDPVKIALTSVFLGFFALVVCATCTVANQPLRHLDHFQFSKIVWHEINRPLFWQFYWPRLIASMFFGMATNYAYWAWFRRPR